mmetsp:Transcript_19076/g.29797  ORF Transcript_19076/g.29797 Transcript_19076/m.29797 type:complete len:143 (+) Transcript_19076:128-556(+)
MRVASFKSWTRFLAVGPARRFSAVASFPTEPADRQDLIKGNTTVRTFLQTPGMCPNGLQLRLITAQCSIWWKSPRECPFPEPWWGFLWPGGYAVSCFILENRNLFAGKAVVDFAAGCGVGMLAARAAGIDNCSPQYQHKWRI